MPEIVMPRLSDSMEEGTILSWKVAVGDTIAVGQEIAEIETDKANMGYEADIAGELSEIIVGENETAAVGDVIARIGDRSEGGPEHAKGQASQAAGPVTAGDPPPLPVAKASSVGVPPTVPPAAPAHSAGDRVKASPLARRVARDAGVDLATLKGSGPGGRIVKADVEGAATPGEAAQAPAAAVEAPAAETAKGQTSYQNLTRLQQVVSRRMSESKATAPHFYLQTEIDMSAAVEARGRIKKLTPEGEVVPSFNDMVVKACAIALKEHPLANGAYKDGRFELYSRVNVGVAVAAQDALVVPTVFDADRKGLREIATDARALAGKVRDGSITPPELSGGTFTVSNLGMYGVTNFSAVINAPQAAILAVGAITEKPVVKDGEITTAHILGVTLACDHRILYGAPAAEFLARIRALLEEPLSLAL
jgi:pyruvate dehydrogenase E2 component (dihydrolipoamide acetyltransferase)